MRYIHTSLTWAGLILLSCLLTTACRQPSNLILNGGAETPPSDSTPKGWKNIEGHWKEVEGDSVKHDYAFAQEGKYHFFEGQDGHGVLEQDIDVSQYAKNIDASKQQGFFSGYARTFQQDPSDQAWITITCTASSDSGAKPLYAFTSDTITTTEKWVHITDTFRIPASTRSIKVSLVANRRNGADNDGYFDNISLSTQQTGFMLNTILIITGVILIAGIAGYTIRKRRGRTSRN